MATARRSDSIFYGLMLAAPLVVHAAPAAVWSSLAQASPDREYSFTGTVHHIGVDDAGGIWCVDSSKM